MEKQFLLQLRQESRLLHLLYHRNKNQHRAAIWWKQFNILKRNVTQVIEQMEKVLYGKLAVDRNYIVLYNQITRLVKKQLGKMYYDFNGVISLGQFVTLGLVLVGMLSRIYNLYTKILESLSEQFIRVGCTKRRERLNHNENRLLIESQLEKITNEEVGVAINDELSIDVSHISQEHELYKSNIPESVKGTMATYDKRTSKKKEKKRKKKSAIDELFG